MEVEAIEAVHVKQYCSWESSAIPVQLASFVNNITL